MNSPIRQLGLTVSAVFFAANLHAANVAGVDVIVKKNGKPMYQGKTDARGNFTTGNLETGAYNVEFRSPKSVDLKGQQLSISVTAGKDAPRQSNADGNQLRSGVAMSIDVARPAKLTGQVSSLAAAAKTQGPAGMEAVRANVKVINGKPHVWVPGPIGSNIGGRWVEEGTEGAALRTSNKKGGDAQVLRSIQDQAGNIGNRPDG